jgi:DNA-binding response OmpR family regulator
MQRRTLDGRSILIVEDEPLIALDITQAFEATGANLTTTDSLEHALMIIEHDDLSGAIPDYALGGVDSSPICARLKERGVPFVIYSGLPTIVGECAGSLHVSKPAEPGKLVAAMERLICPV